jgi:hypothetical protein
MPFYLFFQPQILRGVSVVASSLVPVRTQLVRWEYGMTILDIICLQSAFSITFPVVPIEMTGHMSCGKAGFLVWINIIFASFHIVGN